MENLRRAVYVISAAVSVGLGVASPAIVEGLHQAGPEGVTEGLMVLGMVGALVLFGRETIRQLRIQSTP